MISGLLLKFYGSLFGIKAASRTELLDDGFVWRRKFPKDEGRGQPEAQTESAAVDDLANWMECIKAHEYRVIAGCGRSLLQGEGHIDLMSAWLECAKANGSLVLACGNYPPPSMQGDAALLRCLCLVFDVHSYHGGGEKGEEVKAAIALCLRATMEAGSSSDSLHIGDDGKDKPDVEADQESKSNSNPDSASDFED